MHLKQSHSHLQVVLAIGGSESAETFPLVASNPTLRENFASSALGLVEAAGLDGIGSEALPHCCRVTPTLTCRPSRLGVPQ